MPIYALLDPRTKVARYVGRSRHPDLRLRQHVCSPHSLPLQQWISGLADDGLSPVMSVLGRGSESHWIEKLKPDLNVFDMKQKRAITVWVDDEQGSLLDQASGDIPVSTWARAELLRAARLVVGNVKTGR